VNTYLILLLKYLLVKFPVVSVSRIISNWAVFGLQLQLGCVIWDEKVGSFTSHWMRNGGHRAWGKAPVT
jgi:hypothetical protein